MTEVRARARRRTVGQTVAVAGIAVVSMVAGGVAVAQVRQGPVTTPAATSSPSASRPSVPSLPPSTSPTTPADSSSKPAAPPPATTKSSPPPITEITSAMMLQPQDVGSGFTVLPPSDYHGDWIFEAGANSQGCSVDGFRPKMVSQRWRSLRNDDEQDSMYVEQRTVLYLKGHAAKYLQDIRRRIPDCPQDRSSPMEITAEGFAGDDALMVASDNGDGSISKRVLVRKGDVLTDIWRKKAPSDSAMRELARKAAARL
ncbi:hypothetical protein [Couchioplanes caeruleus]|nr:hypothetical protein [Couchioplanes caeruleus]